MILNKQQIIEQFEKGEIIYHSPLNNKLIDNCKNQSVDVHIGDWIYIPSVEHRGKLIKFIYDCLDYSDDIRKPLDDLEEFGWMDISNPFFHQDHKYITIPEGIFFLAYTEQFIGTIAGSNIHPKFYQRSTIARLGLSHPIAGWGDVGYYNRWCMEFKTEIDFDLYPNMRVGQIVFEDTHSSDIDYTKETGNYQSGDNLDDLIANWKKEDILPKKGNV